MAGVVERLAQRNTNGYLDTNDAWYQFILDHRMYLRSVSRQITVSADDLTQVSYDLDWFLRKNDVNRPISWVVMIINGITHMDFSEPTTLYVPTLTTMQQLYQSYIVSTAAAS